MWRSEERSEGALEQALLDNLNFVGNLGERDEGLIPATEAKLQERRRGERGWIPNRGKVSPVKKPKNEGIRSFTMIEKEIKRARCEG